MRFTMIRDLGLDRCCYVPKNEDEKWMWAERCHVSPTVFYHNQADGHPYCFCDSHSGMRVNVWMRWVSREEANIMSVMGR